MKKLTIYLAFIFVLPVLLQAQYLGGNGRGDVSVSLININLPVHVVTAELPAKYMLAQNYPNPFNPTTNVQFSIINVQYVELKIYDVLGKEISTLVNEKLEPGTYSVDWDASQNPGGVYFYQLKTERFTETRKMILAK